jgi:hypothetical protein
VSSSLIRSIGYDATATTLEIEFHDGDVYQYSQFPEFLYKGLMASASKGSFFNSRVAKRFQHRQVDD